MVKKDGWTESRGRFFPIGVRDILPKSQDSSMEPVLLKPAFWGGQEEITEMRGSWCFSRRQGRSSALWFGFGLLFHAVGEFKVQHEHAPPYNESFFNQ